MVTDAQIAAIVPVSALDASIDYYEKKLGLTFVERREELPDNPEAIFQVGDAALVLYVSVGAGQSRHTLAGFQVDDVEATVRSLRQNGVTFEDYDMPNLKTVDGILTVGGTKAAFFKDPDGNILAIESRVLVAESV